MTYTPQDQVREDIKRYELAPKHRFFFGGDDASNLNDIVNTGESTNGTISYNRAKNVQLTTGDGTSDEFAGIASAYGHERPLRGSGGAKVLLQIFAGFDTDPENMTDLAEVGFCNPTLGTFDQDNIAVVQFGGSTNRFRVNEGATANTVALSGSSFGDPLDNPIQEFHVSILLDFHNDLARCWLNRMPIVDDPDAEITGVKPFNQDRAHGVGIYGNGGTGSETVFARWGEYAIWWPDR